MSPASLETGAPVGKTTQRVATTRLYDAFPPGQSRVVQAQLWAPNGAGLHRERTNRVQTEEARQVWVTRAMGVFARALDSWFFGALGVGCCVEELECVMRHCRRSARYAFNCGANSGVMSGARFLVLKIRCVESLASDCGMSSRPRRSFTSYRVCGGRARPLRQSFQD